VSFLLDRPLHQARCASFNDEPKHWREVRALHESHYDISTPFVIPGPPTKESGPSTPIKLPPETPAPQQVSPQQPLTPAYSVFSSPMSSSVASSSPAKSVEAQVNFSSFVFSSSFSIHAIPVSAETSPPLTSSSSRFNRQCLPDLCEILHGSGPPSLNRDLV